MARAAILLVALSCKRSGCARSTEPAVIPSFAPMCHDGWCWENPLPTGESIADVVATGPGEAWMAIETIRGTTLLHVQPSGVTMSAVPRQITAFARAGKDTWAATREGVVMHLDGSAFVEVDTKNTESLRSIWASAPSDVWAVGDNGTILHFDGVAWTRVPAPRPAELFAVRGRAADDVWIAGDGVILHWDGTAWTVARDVDSGPMARERPKSGGFCGTAGILADEWNRALSEMRGILVMGKNDVWFAGGSGRALHWDGSWNEVKLDEEIRAMWSSGGHAWGVGRGVHELDGSKWTVVAPTSSFSAIDGSGPGDVWAVGWGTIAHFDGTTWKSIGSPRESIMLTSVWIGSDGAGWAVGEQAYALRRTKDGWKRVELPIAKTTAINAIGGADNDDLWAFPRFEKTLHWDGHAWTPIAKEISAFFVRAPARDDVWAVASSSLSHWDGHAWTVFPEGEVMIEDLWAPSKGVAWAIGRPVDPGGSRHDGRRSYDFSKRVLARWDGTRFAIVSPLPDSTAKSLSGFGSDVWIAGDSIQRWDGSTWSVVRPGTGTGTWSILFRGKDDAFVWGAGLEHYDGHAWTPEPIVLTHSTVAFGPKSEIVAWSRTGEIARRD